VHPATSAVSAVTASRTRAGDTMPLASTGTSVLVQPRRPSAFSVFSTASCSSAAATRWRRPVASAASAAPRMAKLSLSVPPLVRTISDGSALISPATAERASSIAALACWPNAWTLDALPKRSRVAAQTASAASGDRGVVAL
jgi:hypothetical protein